MNSNKNFIARSMSRLLLLGAVLVIAACGGGGGDSSSPAASQFQNVNASSSVVNGELPPSSNVASVSITSGPANNINLLFTSITICAPGSSNCQTIDHILVDTGSSGVRIFSSALNPSISLPQKNTTPGLPVAECAHFADGNTWGPVKIADVKISGEQASNIPVQIVGDSQFPAVPNDCSNTGAPLNTVQDFGANGVLGVGLFQGDCGIACAQSTSAGIYFSCASPTLCQPEIVAQADQVQNPVSFFSTNNNGVMITLPAIPTEGASVVTGSLVFGIGTQGNNGLGTANVLAVNPNDGLFTTIYKGKYYRRSFIDSGSNGLFFDDASLPACSSGFYCPPATLLLSAVNQGFNGANSTISFNVASAEQLFSANVGYRAFADLAGEAINQQTFDWGLPFHFGRRVFTALEGKNTPRGTGPYFAY